MTSGSNTKTPRTKEDCPPLLTPDQIKPGDILAKGAFFRNVYAKELARRYSKDDQVEYGRKIKVQKWRWTDKQGQFGLSVNYATCIHCPACSLLFEEENHRHDHVVEFELDILNRKLGIYIIAQYQPAGDNTCHFNLMPSDESITMQQLIALLSKFEQPPFPKHQPSASDREKQQLAKNAQMAYEQVFTIHYAPLEN